MLSTFVLWVIQDLCLGQTSVWFISDGLLFCPLLSLPESYLSVLSLSRSLELCTVKTFWTSSSSPLSKVSTLTQRTTTSTTSLSQAASPSRGRTRYCRWCHCTMQHSTVMTCESMLSHMNMSFPVNETSYWMCCDSQHWETNSPGTLSSQESRTQPSVFCRWLRWSASKKSTSTKQTARCAQTWTWTGLTLHQREASSTACSEERQVLVLRQLSEGVGAKVLPLFLLFLLPSFPGLVQTH